MRLQLGESCELILRTATSTSLLRPLQSGGSQSPTSAVGTPAYHFLRVLSPVHSFAHRFLPLSPPVLPACITAPLTTLQCSSRLHHGPFDHPAMFFIHVHGTIYSCSPNSRRVGRITRPSLGTYHTLSVFRIPYKQVTIGTRPAI